MDDSTSIRDPLIRRILEASDEQVSAADVTNETSLRGDLDLSSMQAITLVMDLEDDFGVTVEDDELQGLETVGDVLTLIRFKLSTGGSS